MPTPEHRSPGQPESSASLREKAESLAERLHLKEQYRSQVKILYQSRLIESFPATNQHPRPELGIIGVDQQQHYLPDYQNLLDRLSANPEKAELIAKKIEQGFTRLLLVPLALPLETIIQKYKETLLLTNQKPGGIKSTDGSHLELDTEDPLCLWEELLKSDQPQTPPDQQLEYQVRNYDGSTKEQRQGKYKSELLTTNPSNAWQILLVEDCPDIPAEGKGQTKAGRKQIEANQSAKDYLQLLQTDPQYQSEQGLTPEAQLLLSLTRLQETQTATNDWQGSGKINRLVGTYLAGDVPYFCWFRVSRRPDLGGFYPGFRDFYAGFSPAVSV